MNDDALFELLAEHPIPNIIANDEYMTDEIAWRFQAIFKNSLSLHQQCSTPPASSANLLTNLPAK